MDGNGPNILLYTVGLSKLFVTKQILNLLHYDALGIPDEYSVMPGSTDKSKGGGL